MNKIKFNAYYVKARKDLLHFVEEHINKEILNEIGKNPTRWIEELALIYGMLTRGDLVAGIGIHQPPKEDAEFKKIGENVFIYRGNIQQLRGLWISKILERSIFEKEEFKSIQYTQWTHCRMGSAGDLFINSDFGNINIEDLLPENFEPKSKVVKSDKRPILVFDLQIGKEKITVYAKGCCINSTYLYSPPSYRLTNLIRISKISSEKEKDITLKLAENEVNVPVVLGYYTSAVEDFLFLKKVDGKNPKEFLDTHRKQIIEQDAQMLAVLCLLGYNKSGFTDFEDKVFDGQKLYLIDVDECSDLYCHFFTSNSFREVLLDVSNTKELRKFRMEQRSLFKTLLKDAIFEYDSSLTPNLEDKVRYIEGFYKKLGWKKPTEREIKHYTGFSGNYVTLERSVSMMMEE